MDWVVELMHVCVEDKKKQQQQQNIEFCPEKQNEKTKTKSSIFAFRFHIGHRAPRDQCVKKKK